MSYWSLLPAAAGFLTTALTKPKKQTYSSEYMDRYLANLRGEKVSGDVRRLSMMGDIKAIGKSTGKALRQIRAEETDPGIRTSAIVDLYKGEGELLGEASQRANILQAQESARISERQSTAEMYQARVKDEITRANEIAEEEWQSRMMAGGVGLAASGVAAFGEQAYQKKALLQKGYQSAMAENLIPQDTTLEDYKAISSERGFTDYGIYNKMLASDKAKMETTSFIGAIGEFAKTGELPEGIDMETLSPQQQLSIAQIQAGETASERKRIAGLENQFQQQGIPWTPIEGEDADITANRLMKERDVKFAEDLGFDYSEDKRVFEMNLKKYLEKASAELSKGISVFTGTSKKKSEELSELIDTTTDETDKMKLLNLWVESAKAEQESLTGKPLTTAQKIAFDKAEMSRFAISKELDRAIDNVVVGTEQAPTVEATKQIQEVLDAGSNVTFGEYQQMVNTLKDVSKLVPIAVLQELEAYKDVASENIQEKWWQDKARLIRNYLAITGRLVGEAEGNEWSQFEVVK